MTATDLIDIAENGTDAQIDAAASWLAWKMRGCPLTPPAHLNARGESQWLTRLQAALRKPRQCITYQRTVPPSVLSDAAPSVAQSVEPWVADSSSASGAASDALSRSDFRARHGIDHPSDVERSVECAAEKRARMRGQM